MEIQEVSELLCRDCGESAVDYCKQTFTFTYFLLIQKASSSIHSWELHIYLGAFGSHAYTLCSYMNVTLWAAKQIATVILIY